MHITGTHFNYYQVCKRKLWLFANGIQMEHTSDLVAEGKLIHEYTYPQRSAKYEEIQVEGIKIDYYDARDKVIHEIKKSDKIENAHEWQLKYYIYVLEQHGISGVKGILEYPALRKTANVSLTEDDRREIQRQLKLIDQVIGAERCPPVEKKARCRSCSYYEFCFVTESAEG